MSGRAIDQVLPFTSSPQIFEPWIKDSREYITLAQRKHGKIPCPVDYPYVWGDALNEIHSQNPRIKIINLETAITTSLNPWPFKGINYKMHPENIELLRVAGIDICALSNNHVLDWGFSGLEETILCLKTNGISFAGAGMNLSEAQRPAVCNLGSSSRLLLFSVGFESSGIPPQWKAERDSAGVVFYPSTNPETLIEIKSMIQQFKQPEDLVILSVHWGENWEFNITPKEKQFAHDLIDQAGVDIVHGHSSHHVKGIEVYNERLILYGCGDFLNDYEGIGGKDQYRGDLSLIYFADIDPDGKLIKLEMTPTTIRNFRIHYTSQSDLLDITRILNRENKKFNTRVERIADNRLCLRW
ncbi:poly-gamma-glutamate synthesis protein [Chitinispirillum alkaliphilum]|nr:poly-gamma-glutamate synthesis protein [Chitinispirillum alkaliphilum]